MKYFKKYDNLISEKSTSDHDFSVLSLFKPLLSMFKFNFVNTKLNLIGIQYDAYLTRVYKEYLKNVKEIEVNNNTEPINKESEIIIDKSDEKLTYDVPSNTTDDFKPIPFKNKEPIVAIPDEISEPIELDVKPSEKEDYDDSPKSVVNQYLKNNDYDGLKQERKDFIEHNSDLSTEITDIEFQLKDLLKNKNSALKKLNDISNKHNKLSLNDEIRKINSRITSLEKNKKIKSDKLSLNNDFIKEIDTALKNVNESSDWKANAIHNEKWSDEDVKKITRTVNTYQIEEFFIQAEYLIDKCEDKDKAKAKMKWNTINNNINKKWYYTFNVKELRNATIKFQDEKSLQKGAEMNIVMSKILTEEFNTFKIPFKGIKEDNKHEYYIMSVIDNLYLLKKITTSEDKSYFYLMCELIGSKDNKNLIVRMSTMYNNIENYIKLNIKGNRIRFSKGKNEYPIIMLEDNKLFPINEDFTKDYYMKLDKNTTLYNVSKNDLENIFELSHIKTPKFKKDDVMINKLQKIM